MAAQLYPEDCRAIDLMLDQGVRASSADANRFVTRSTSSVASDRLVAVQRVMSLLALMPAPEPPANLISKTLARIDKTPGVGSHTSIPAMRYDRSQPPA